MTTTGRQKAALMTFRVVNEVFGDVRMEKLEDPSRPSAAYYLLRALRMGPREISKREESNDAAEE